MLRFAYQHEALILNIVYSLPLASARGICMNGTKVARLTWRAALLLHVLWPPHTHIHMHTHSTVLTYALRHSRFVWLMLYANSRPPLRRLQERVYCLVSCFGPSRLVSAAKKKFRDLAATISPTDSINHQHPAGNALGIFRFQVALSFNARLARPTFVHLCVFWRHPSIPARRSPVSDNFYYQTYLFAA